MSQGSCPYLCLQQQESCLLLPFYLPNHAQRLSLTDSNTEPLRAEGSKKCNSPKGGQRSPVPNWKCIAPNQALINVLLPCDISCSDIFYSFTSIHLLFDIFKCMFLEGRSLIDSITPSLILHISGAEVVVVGGWDTNYLLVSVRLWAHGVGDTISLQKNILPNLHIYRYIRSTQLYTDRMSLWRKKYPQNIQTCIFIHGL